MRTMLVWIVAGVLLAASGRLSAARCEERPRDLIHAYRVWKLTEALDLSDEQMPVFFSRLRQVDDMEADLIEDERRLVSRIGEMLESDNVSDQDLKQMLADHAEVRRKRLEEIGKLRNETMSVLDIRQRARYVVFEYRFRSDLRKMIERAKNLRPDQRMDERPGMRGNQSGRPGHLDPPGQGRGKRGR